MPNANYRRGRYFEYSRKHFYEEQKYIVIRAAGSHGRWDLIAIRDGDKPLLIQCKVVQTEKQAEHEIAEFVRGALKDGPYHEIIDVYVRDKKDVQRWVL